MSDRGGFQPTPRVKTALDNRKLTLQAPTPGHKGKFAALTWQLVANNPRIVVYTNDPEDTGRKNDNGAIKAAFGMLEAFAAFSMLDKMIKYDGPLPYKETIDNMNYTWFNNERSKEPVLVSQFHCGKDEHGVIWLSVTAANRPKIKFPIQVSNFHQMRKGDGTPFTAGEASLYAAQGYLKFMSELLTVMADSHWEEPKPKGDKAGGGGGNRGSYGGGGGGRSNDSDVGMADEVEGMPF